MSVYIKNFGEFTNFKYVDSNRNTHDIKSVYYGPALVWPQEYKVKITPSFSSRRLAPTANYTTVQWNTTIYYPNSDVVVAEGTINSNEVDNVVIQVSKDQSTWTTVTSSDSSYSGNNTINGTWSFQSKGTNGLGSSGRNDPISDGPWYYRISCRIPYTILNKTYYAIYINNTSYDVMIGENTYSLTSTIYDNADIRSLTIYNNSKYSQENNSNHPASYARCNVYAIVSWDRTLQYTFASEDTYLKKEWDNDPKNFNWYGYPSSWIYTPRTNSTGEIELSENTDSTADRQGSIEIYPKLNTSIWESKNVYQSAAPEPEPDPNSSS